MNQSLPPVLAIIIADTKPNTKTTIVAIIFPKSVSLLLEGLGDDDEALLESVLAELVEQDEECWGMFGLTIRPNSSTYAPLYLLWLAFLLSICLESIMLCELSLLGRSWK